jgi:hypothetical protein
MSTVKFTDHAVLMCHLAEYQDKLDESVDKATIEYLHAQEYARNKLQVLREAIDLRDAMLNVRKHIGGTK